MQKWEYLFVHCVSGEAVPGNERWDSEQQDLVPGTRPSQYEWVMNWDGFIRGFSDGEPLMYDSSKHFMSDGLRILGEYGWEMMGVKIEERIDRLHESGDRNLPFHLIFKRPKLEQEE